VNEVVRSVDVGRTEVEMLVGVGKGVTEEGDGEEVEEVEVDEEVLVEVEEVEDELVVEDGWVTGGGGVLVTTGVVVVLDIRPPVESKGSPLNA
jgi:hypothetical protein